MTEKTLSEFQREFTLKIGRLILWAYEHNFELTFGEAYRTPEQAALNAKAGKGVANSLHTQRLAIDLNLYINGEYQSLSEAHRPLGEYWESIGGTWGGRFTKPDGNHYSLAYNGVK